MSHSRQDFLCIATQRLRSSETHDACNFVSHHIDLRLSWFSSTFFKHKKYLLSSSTERQQPHEGSGFLVRINEVCIQVWKHSRCTDWLKQHCFQIRQRLPSKSDIRRCLNAILKMIQTYELCLLWYKFCQPLDTQMRLKTIIRNILIIRCS